MTNVYAMGFACLLTLLTAASAEAREWRPWCGAEASPLGWHFYCDRDEKKDEETQAGQAPKAKSAKERILATRQALEEARAQAILEPSPENVTAYLHLQQKALQSAAAFSDAFRRAVWSNPGSRLHAETPGGRAREETLDGRAPGGARRLDRTA